MGSDRLAARVAELEGALKSAYEALSNITIQSPTAVYQEWADAAFHILENATTAQGKRDLALKKVAPLLQEVIRQHADKDAPEYNQCDTAPCKWCSEAKRILSEHTPISDRNQNQ